jgi:hypothetical protein
MFDLERAISMLRDCFDKERRLRNQRVKDYSKLDDLDIQERIDDTIEKTIKEVLVRLIRFPPHHSRHASSLKEFLGKDRYEECVFVMTKFPEGNEAKDLELKRVIKLVMDAIQKAGFSPRIASGQQHHSLLWDNIELYLLGCSRGIAIIEDQYRPELNPNVALEAGWMRGMGKKVLYLVEKSFDHNRADWSGFLDYKFSWDNPESEIEEHVENWLRGDDKK